MVTGGLLGLNTGQQRYCTKKLGLATLLHLSSNAITLGQQQYYTWPATLGVQNTKYLFNGQQHYFIKNWG